MTECTKAERLGIENADVAAAQAAVTFFMQEEPVALPPQRIGVNPWRAASMLEGARSGRRNSCPGGWNAWKSMLSLSLVLQAIGFCNSALADDYSMMNDSSSAGADGASNSSGLDNDQAAISDSQIASSAQSSGYQPNFRVTTHKPTRLLPAGYQAPGRAVSRVNTTTTTTSTTSSTNLGNSNIGQVFGAARTYGSDQSLIRVGLVLGAKNVQIDVPDGALVASATGEAIALLPNQSHWNINSCSSGSIAFNGRTNQDLPIRPPSPGDSSRAAYTPGVPPSIGTTVPPALLAALTQGGGYIIVPGGKDPANQVIALNGKLYRGAMFVRANQSQSGPDRSVNVINILPVEDYLLSVLPSEMPSTWPAQSLQAQAIAARSYAFANMGKHSRDGYDLRPTIDDQVYLGVSSEHQSSNDAVAATNGLVVKYGGKCISAFFHSTSGGATEVSENVWSRSLPYLKSVVDYDDNSPHFLWTRKMSNSDIEAVFGKDIGRLVSIAVTDRSPSNRARSVTVTGSTGTKVVTGDSLRLTLKLPSSNFNVGCEENGYSFAGRGFGHGLGMSQYGAKALAEQGYNAAQIVAYYYKDVSVEYVSAAAGI